jgi:chorismate synthase
MLALVLMDHALRNRAQNADVVCKTPKIPGKVTKKKIAPPRAKIKPKSKENPEPDEA